MNGEDTFLSRWSKRKRHALIQPADDVVAPPGGSEEGRTSQPAQGEDQPFDLSLLPDLEALTGASDIQAFMHKAVPDALRNAALRKVWALDPSVRNYVGEALDYAYDWNTPGGVPGFGEILSNEQTAEFVRNLLAGPGANENVIEDGKEDAAAQQDETPPHEGRQDAIADPSVTSHESSQTIVNKVFNEPDEEFSAQPGSVSQPRRKLRHGGALPS